jgi:hypothetical protein
MIKRKVFKNSQNKLSKKSSISLIGISTIQSKSKSITTIKFKRTESKSVFSSKKVSSESDFDGVNIYD